MKGSTARIWSGVPGKSKAYSISLVFVFFGFFVCLFCLFYQQEGNVTVTPKLLEFGNANRSSCKNSPSDFLYNPNPSP